MSRVKQIVGLDLGNRTVRAAWVQLRRGEPRIVRTEQTALPLEGGNPQALIRSWLERLDLTRGFAAGALPGAQVVFQPGRLSPEDPRTPRQAAEMELATFNDMAGDTMISDTASHEWSPGLRVYLMAMARPAVVAQSLANLEPLGVRPADLIPAPVAMFNALVRLVGSSGSGAPDLFLNIGHTQTELAIGTPKGLLFARSVPTGGRTFSEAVAKLAGVPLPQAEAQKQRDGSLRSGGAFAEALRPVAERWYAQVASCLSAYRGVFGGEPFAIGRIVLAGGGAHLQGLDDFVRERSGLPVTLATALKGTVAGHPDVGCFDVAIGLALTALEVASTHLSLLPAKLRDEVVFREKKPYWIAASIMGALTLGIFTAGMLVALRVEARTLEAERSELRKREQLDKGITTIRQRSEALRARCEPLARLLRGGPAMREVISLVANAISPDDWISLICDESAYLPALPPAARPAAPPPRAGFFVPGFRGAARATTGSKAVKSDSPPAPVASGFDVFIVEGYTPDSSLKTVKAMMERLRTATRVKKVDLLSDDRVLPPVMPEELAGLTVEIPDMRRFVMRLEVTPP